MWKRMACVLLVCLVLAVPAFAQDVTFEGEDNPDLIRELLARTLAPFIPVTEAVRVTVGALPENLELPLPDQTTVIGSVVNEGPYPYTRVFIDTENAVDLVRSFYTSRLTAEGWELLDNAPNLNSGFTPSSQEGLTFCAPDLDVLNLVLLEQDETTEIYVIYQDDPQGGACASNSELRSSNADSARLIPRMEAPEGAQVRGGGSGGGGDSWHSTAEIVTDLSAEALFSHYNAQITENAGWTQISANIEGNVGVSTWQLTEGGDTWNGVLVIFGGGDLTTASFQVARDR